MGIEQANADLVLERILSSYGFTMQKELSDKLDIARNNISGWLQRNSIPAGVILQCSLDTGANVNWLVNGELEKSSSDLASSKPVLPTGKKLYDLIVSSGGKAVLKRILEAYGFSTQKQLGDLLEISSGTMSAWVRRDYFPGEVVVTCALDTGADLQWLATGEGVTPAKRVSVVGESHSGRIPKFQFVSGELKASGEWACDESLIPATITDAAFIAGSKTSWVIDRGAKNFSNGLWFVAIDGAIDLCDITRLPGNRLSIKTGSTQYECDVKDVEPVGAVFITVNQFH
ncbi:TPA: phage repressor protein CI [Citrobacter braakii]|nr:phage repressor protein CI [Citrobacter freundii]